MIDHSSDPQVVMDILSYRHQLIKDHLRDHQINGLVRRAFTCKEYKKIIYKVPNKLI